MEKLHKRNLIIVWCSVVALSLVSLMGYGFTVLAIRGIAILVVAGIISTIGCYLPIDDAKKVLILVFPPAIGTRCIRGYMVAIRFRIWRILYF